MARILVRSAQDPRKIYPPVQASRRMGGNSGNLLYANAVFRALSTSGTRVVPGGFDAHTLEDPTEWVERINRRFDRYVMPMSNAFRFPFSEGLARMTRIVQQLDMPVTVVGVGAQTTADAAENESFRMGRTGSDKLPSAAALAKHDRTVRAFADAVLDKSESIGVRGELTKRYLVSLGVDASRVDVIGCPSIFTWGPGLRVRTDMPGLTSRSRISMNVDYRVGGIGPIVERNAAAYKRLTSPSQDARSARMIINGSEGRSTDHWDPATPIHTGHVLYRTKRLFFYPNPWGWIEDLARYDFVFGNRLHGNIAGIIGGTPAHLLAHDSRTRELAEYHGIPYTLMSDLSEPPLAEELYGRTDYTRFNELMPERFATYLDFLHRNGLETVFDEGQDNGAAFDETIEKGRKVRAVRPTITPIDKVLRRVGR
ncbi:polysaccharide pyruvyl transferase [Flavimobilis soli]|uniref:Polysaccharide pyruvyl transferase n=1 Tax=Flavimobilis soli TaxID=442709 RepID=A0A2A9EG72_9MICO|nr:polysaccharide pyruvyl transferase family protein [Flavimobilis soli]PFG37616.1 polysaccharide pyruvyl transferase [Flavimobilis soli]